jgi:NADPH:quinone reductase-like Zn-dependent oxidoreductase
VCTGYGPPDVLELRQVEKPVPKDHEVLIRVHATTVHRGDVRIRRFDVPRGRRFMARLVLGFTRPKNPILGMELAGEVESVVGREGRAAGDEAGQHDSLGADRVIDYTQQDFTEGDETYDVVFDAVDKLSSSRAKRPLEKSGVYLNVNRDSGSGGGSPEDLVFLKELIETGKVRTVIDRRYALEEIGEAHTYMEKGHKRGNVVVTVSQRSEGFPGRRTDGLRKRILLWSFGGAVTRPQDNEPADRG